MRALLFDPGVVFQVVDAAAVGVAQFEHVVRGLSMQVAGEIGGGSFSLYSTEFLVHLMDARAIEFHRVGQHGDHDVVLVHLIIFGSFDAGKNIRDAGEAEQIKIGDDGFGHTFFDEIGASVLFVEEARDVDHRVIVNGGDNICVLGVVDPRHVLVADAFDAMRAESVFEQGGALQGFAGDDLAIGEEFLHVIAAGDRACRTCGRCHAADSGHSVP